MQDTRTSCSSLWYMCIIELEFVCGLLVLFSESDSKKAKPDQQLPLKSASDSSSLEPPALPRIVSRKVEELSAEHVSANRAKEEEIKKIDPNYSTGTPSVVRNMKRRSFSLY